MLNITKYPTGEDPKIGKLVTHILWPVNKEMLRIRICGLFRLLKTGEAVKIELEKFFIRFSSALITAFSLGFSTTAINSGMDREEYLMQVESTLNLIRTTLLNITILNEFDKHSLETSERNRKEK